jgi:hypothetical protein
VSLNESSGYKLCRIVDSLIFLSPSSPQEAGDDSLEKLNYGSPALSGVRQKAENKRIR